ncbi:MAG: lipoyl synthase [Myxococcota bacterium]
MTSLPILDADAPAQPERHRPWLRVRAPTGERYRALKQLLEERRLHTVCSSAACPNVGECWNAGTATFMILGNLCTRACRFCDVKTSNRPLPVDLGEPERLADAAALMELRHVVITSVARDDLEDGGARHFARCIRAVKQRIPGSTVEVLVPDFRGDRESVGTVLDAGCDVFNHNLETVSRLTRQIRSGAQYGRSLAVLQMAKEMRPDVLTKSGVMLGLGESDDEVRQAIADLRAHRTDILTIGQYLRPSPGHHEVMRYAEPQLFDELGAYARELGFHHVESGPLVRSSYHAERGVEVER